MLNRAKSWARHLRTWKYAVEWGSEERTEESASSLKDRGFSQRAVDKLICAFADGRREQPSRYGGVNESDGESDDN